MKASEGLRCTVSPVATNLFVDLLHYSLILLAPSIILMTFCIVDSVDLVFMNVLILPVPAGVLGVYFSMKSHLKFISSSSPCFFSISTDLAVFQELPPGQ